MCGYIRRQPGDPGIPALIKSVGLDHLADSFDGRDASEQPSTPAISALRTGMAPCVTIAASMSQPDSASPNTTTAKSSSISWWESARLLMGELYRPFDNGCYCCTVMTRYRHPWFDAYHDKAFPLFVPPEKAFLDAWLNQTGEVPDRVSEYLADLRITEDLWVSIVKTFKRATTTEDAAHLRRRTAFETCLNDRRPRFSMRKRLYV